MGNISQAPASPADLDLQKKRRIWEALQPQAVPQNVGQGLTALGDAFTSRQDAQDANFPTVPGGGQADWATNLRNLFTFGRNGGLY